MNNYCLYHDSCPDGFAAALAVWQKFGDSFQYLPVQYNQPFPEMNDIDTLYIVDFSFPTKEMIELELQCNQLIMIDHHDLKDRLEGWMPSDHTYFFYNQDHSGAVLTYKYLNYNQEIPSFFLYIEDRDLWKWKLPSSREFSAGLELTERSFPVWNTIADSYSAINATIDVGSTVLKFINQKVKTLAEKAIILKDENNLTYARVNSSLFQSEIGEYLCQSKDIDYADIYFIIDNPDSSRRMVHSLRSQGRANVTDIAKSKGGGGHCSNRSAGYSEIL